MFTYPQLTAAEQNHLPQLLVNPSALASRFNDSTHHLWHCKTNDGEMVLKVCNHSSVTHSPFWLGLNHLFDANFPNNLGEIQFTHDFLTQHGTLAVPDLIASQANRFVLTRFLVGVDLDANEVDDKWVVKLAKHIEQLHRCTHKNWGSLHTPKFSAEDWGKRLHETLKFLTTKFEADFSQSHQLNTLVLNTLAHAKNIHETEFVPMMLDLRWDQLRQIAEDDLALIDLDAFVIAPKNLDLVLLEYVLSPAQWALFKQHYQAIHPWPNDVEHKSCYQLLLFLMHILGEKDLDKWMQRF